jgi:serine/threonine-protein kinase
MRSGRGPFALDELVLLLDPAATAIAYAHEQGVVHRDIKPGNLFLAETRDGLRVKVLDFGLAKILHPEAIVEPSQETMTGLYICSPSYGAPEQFSPKFGTVGPWSDVYSFALVMLELLSGHKARHAKNLQEAIVKIADPAIAQPMASKMGLALPASVERVLRRAVSQYAEERPKDATVFWNELRDAMLDSADDFATISNDQLPGGHMISEALAKAGVRRVASGGSLEAVSSRGPLPSARPPSRASVSAPVPNPVPVPAPLASAAKAGPPDQTVKLDRDQLEAFAKKVEPHSVRSRGDERPSRGREPVSMEGGGAGRAASEEPAVRAVPPTLISKAPPSVAWLWIVAALALVTSTILLWQALRP